MTLIVSLATGSMVLHVGDRLLTRRGASWDPLANKSIVVLGIDGFACVSYSGLAYIDSKPTDQWLAEEISERHSLCGPQGAPAIMFDSSLTPRVGPALARVRAAIDREFGISGTQHRSVGISVEVAGFIVRRRRSPQPKVRPFVHRYSHSGQDKSRLVRNELPRYWDWARQLRMGSVGVVADEAKRTVLDELASPGHRNQDDCERLLVDCIRTVAENNTGVGKHCMSVVISRDGDVRVRFLPDIADDRRAVAYTPWVVGPGGVWPPLELTGGLPEIHAGGYQVEFDRLPPFPPSLPLGASGQPRKPFR